jgi:adenine-specific DNA-methyltransferase
LPILEEIADHKILTGDHNAPTNLIIEGDNYHALSVLNWTHKGKINVIYIDPPYNTGNKDFMYNDRFIDKEDNFKHSEWLSFMYKRLVLAKDLR